MATLPRYQQRGVTSADFPQISIAPQQAAISGAGALDQALNRMTSYFENRAVTDAKTAALKYAAENPLTEDQVKYKLLTPEKLKVDGAGRIFQQSYEEAQAKILGTNILLEQEAELGEIGARIEAGEVVDLGSIQRDLKNRRDGVATLLNEIDPGVALQVSKGIAQSGNALLKLAAKKDAETKSAIAAQKLEFMVEGILPALEMQIEQQVGTMYMPTPAEAAQGKQAGEIRAMDFIADQSRRVELMAAAANQPGAYEKFMDGARKAMSNVAVRRLTTGGGAVSTIDAINKMDAGDLGNLSNMYQQEFTQEERDQIRTNVMAYWGDKHTAAERVRAAEVRQNKIDAVKVWDSYFQGNIGDDELIVELQGLEELTVEKLKAIREGGGRDASPSTYASYLTQAQNGNMGQNKINEMLARNEISLKQWSDLNKEINNQGTESSNARTYIRKILGVPEGLDIAGQFSRQRAAAARVEAEFLRLQAEAMAQGLPFNPMSVAMKLAKAASTEDPDAVAVSEERTTLNDLMKEYNLPGDPLKYTTKEMVMDAGVDDQYVAQEIVNLVTMITGAGK